VRSRRLVPFALAAAPIAYRAGVRALLRRNLRLLNSGNSAPLFRTYGDNVAFHFPGESSWAADLRGREAVQRWVERFVDVGLKLEPREILVSGPPWATRICLCYDDELREPDGTVAYSNRGTIVGTIAWGKLVRYEVFEDTEKVAAFDEYLSRS
jgi:ketosteroid isomerase-like protein